jgi:hypothetical protein
MSQRCCRTRRETQRTWEWFISMRGKSGPRTRRRIKVVRHLDWRNSGKNHYYYPLRLTKPPFCECGQYAANCIIYTWLNTLLTVSSEIFENHYHTTRFHTHHHKFLKYHLRLKFQWSSLNARRMLQAIAWSWVLFQQLISLRISLPFQNLNFRCKYSYIKVIAATYFMSTLESSVQFENIFYPYIFSEKSKEFYRMGIMKLTAHLF